MAPLVVAAPYIAAAISAAGVVYSGIQAKRTADFNEDVANRDAEQAQIKAKYDEGIHRDKVKRILAEQRGVIGKSGVDIAGTPLLAMLDTIETGELDALAIRQGGDVSSQTSLSRAENSRLEGSSALTSSLFKAGSTLLTGASKIKLPASKPALDINFGGR